MKNRHHKPPKQKKDFRLVHLGIFVTMLSMVFHAAYQSLEKSSDGQKDLLAEVLREIFEAFHSTPLRWLVLLLLLCAALWYGNVPRDLCGKILAYLLTAHVAVTFAVFLEGGAAPAAPRWIEKNLAGRTGLAGSPVWPGVVSGAVVLGYAAVLFGLALLLYNWRRKDAGARNQGRLLEIQDRLKTRPLEGSECMEVLPSVRAEAGRIKSFLADSVQSQAHVSIAVVAPWGSGKTSLVNAMTSGEGCDCLAIRIDVATNDTKKNIFSKFYDALEALFDRHRMNNTRRLEKYFSAVMQILGVSTPTALGSILPSFSDSYSISREIVCDDIVRLLRRVNRQYLAIIIDDIDRADYRKKQDYEELFNFIAEICRFDKCVTIYCFEDLARRQVKDTDGIYSYLTKYVDKIYQFDEFSFLTQETVTQHLKSLLKSGIKHEQGTESRDARAVLSFIVNSYGEFAERLMEEVRKARDAERAKEGGGAEETEEAQARKKKAEPLAEFTSAGLYNLRFLTRFLWNLAISLRTNEAESENEGTAEENKKWKEIAYELFAIFSIGLCCYKAPEYLAAKFDRPSARPQDGAEALMKEHYEKLKQYGGDYFLKPYEETVPVPAFPL
ncbi:MAG: hypothetical protein LBQ15_02535 [Clostridium sp.]|jgi:hypothetical protein|nr:hypothetical protein [Clostridium sp.]